jgi:hypothetical protein
MELVIPGVALGLLYVVTNQNKNKENFRSSQLPNVDIPNTNYPSEYPITSPELDQTSQLSTNNRYDNTDGTYTDKYFNPNTNDSLFTNNSITPLSGNSTQFYSLTGDKVDSSYFQHNNMVPYFGSNLKTRIADENSNEGLLDSYSGSGSQIITKKEQSPLFSPNENLQWAFGAPNQTDFYQSRVNPSSRMANVKPFEEEHVAPGLGLGYGSQGAGGYNSGMLARESWLDKNADQLRVSNKPKATGLSLLGHEGPADSMIKRIATQEQMGVMEKNRPETSYAWDTRDMVSNFDSGPTGGDFGRLMPGGGVEKAQTLRATPIERFVNRPETSISYSGIAGAATESSYLPGEYMPSHNQQLGDLPIGVANANGRGYANDADYGIKSKMAYPNNRSVNKQNPGGVDYYGIVGGGMGAVIAPLLDVLRPNRKNNVIGTLRPYQNPSTTVPNSYIFNPNDRPNVTIRETTEDSKGHLNMNAPQVGAYQVTDQQVAYTNRNEVGAYGYVGGSSAGERGRKMTSYEANYNQRNNDLKSSTIKGYMVQGNMALMNGDINMRQISRDDMLKNDRAVIGGMPPQIPDASIIGKPSGTNNQLYSNINLDRNTSDITNMLKSNPYVVDYRSAL